MVTVHLVSVILTGKTRVVVIVGMDSAVTQQDIVLVVTVQTTHVYTESGRNRGVHKSGDTTESVVNSTPNLTVHQASVILTGINRVVVVLVMDDVVKKTNIVFVGTAQTISY